MQKKEFDVLSPFLDDRGVIRVGGRVDNAVVTYDSRHPALVPYGHSISLLITRHIHQCGHRGVASTTVKIRARYWILKAKHYGVIFTCLNTPVVHLEMAGDSSSMEFMQNLRRFFSIRGYPAVMNSDNRSQMVGAARELREMVEGFDKDQLLVWRPFLRTTCRICIYPCYVAYMNAMRNKYISKHVRNKLKVSDKTKRCPTQVKDVR